MIRLFTRLFVLVTLAWAAAPGQAEIYRCLDSGGRPLFQDRPCAGAEATPAAPAAAAAPTAESGQQRHFLWRVEGDDAHAWLLGSLHYGHPDLYPLPTVMEEAFDSAGALVVEANVRDADPAEMLTLLSEQGVYGDGSTLRDHLAPETWTRLEAVIGELGLPPEIILHQRPWLASLTVTALALKRAGLDEGLGIDRHFLERAGAGKPILELESVRGQIRLLQELTEADQERMLAQTIADLDEVQPYFTALVDAWSRGDAEALRLLTLEQMAREPGGKALQERLFTERNAAMAGRVAELLRQGGSYFVVVGAGHLVGSNGVVARLQRRGYRVRQH
jgi:uncharacterized protein YbaP (TraB family)